MSGAFGQVVKEKDLQKEFLTGPGEFLVANTLLQLSSIQNETGKAFTQLFGAYKPGSQTQRWADYARHDWSLRQLPVINVYEADPQEKTSSNAWLLGQVNVMVLWPPSQRRSDWSRVAMAFNGALQNFFESQACTDMLDELASIQRPAKVPGLNEYGKQMTWVPNVEGIVESEAVPVTLVNVKYRLDLRAWYRAMEFDDRLKLDPFRRTLSDLKVIGGEYDGVIDFEGEQVEVSIPDEIQVNQP